MNSIPDSVIILGATGAVGGQALLQLINDKRIKRITTLGRRPVANIKATKVVQETIDVFNPESYQDKLANHQVAVCTFGVGEPSKISKEDFIKIDKLAVIDFAKACKENGVQHFELLASVGIGTNSNSFYLRIKGELVEELKVLNFKRLSVFQPSMILTPNNRYGIAQAITLKVWPVISKLFMGSLKKYKGIDVALLGKAFATNIFEDKNGLEMITWEDIVQLSKMEIQN